MSFRLFLFGDVSGPRDPKRIDHTSSLIVTLSFLKHIGYSSQCPNHLWLSSASTTFLILLEEIGTSLFFQFFVFYSWISRVSNVHDLSLLYYCYCYYLRYSSVVGIDFLSQHPSPNHRLWEAKRVITHREDPPEKVGCRNELFSGVHVC